MCECSYNIKWIFIHKVRFSRAGQLHTTHWHLQYTTAPHITWWRKTRAKTHLSLLLVTADATIPATAAEIRNSITPTIIIMHVREHHPLHLYDGLTVSSVEESSCNIISYDGNKSLVYIHYCRSNEYFPLLCSSLSIVVIKFVSRVHKVEVIFTCAYLVWRGLPKVSSTVYISLYINVNMNEGINQFKEPHKGNNNYKVY